MRLKIHVIYKSREYDFKLRPFEFIAASEIINGFPSLQQKVVGLYKPLYTSTLYLIKKRQTGRNFTKIYILVLALQSRLLLRIQTAKALVIH